jgi:3-oxoacyl-[acyl-carrier-protein] synthase II
VEDSGLATNDALGEELATRIGVNIGAGIGGLPMIEHTHAELTNRGPRRISPFFVPASIINMISGHVSIKYGFKGPNIAVVTACTTGLHAIGLSARMIESGDADVMVAGGAESAVSPLGIGGFAASRALSTRNDDPKTASRPWDKDRDGFVLGEGGGVLVLEEYEHAKARGARIYAEVIGFGMTADAYHMTAPNVSGPARSMAQALRNAGLNADQVQYLNAHGTFHAAGRPERDQCDQAGPGRTCEESGGQLDQVHDRPPPGRCRRHRIGVHGAGIHHQKSPPTINIFNQDPECDLDYCANTARDMKIDVALKNNFGFGGTNGTLVFKRI